MLMLLRRRRDKDRHVFAPRMNWSKDNKNLNILDDIHNLSCHTDELGIFKQ